MILIAAAAAIALIIIVAIYQNKKRQERIAAFQGLASQLGFSYYPYADADEAGLLGMLGLAQNSEMANYLAQFGGFYPFGRGLSREVTNMITGRKEALGWSIFDYKYEEEHTSTDSEGRTTTSRTSYWYTVLIAQFPIGLPAMKIGREGFFSRIGNAMGFRDIEFESNEFNRRFRVTCSDRKLAYDIIDPQQMDYLLSGVDVDWQIAGPYLVHAISGTIPVQQVPMRMAAIEGFYQHIPEFVKQDLGPK